MKKTFTENGRCLSFLYALSIAKSQVTSGLGDVFRVEDLTISEGKEAKDCI